MEIYGNIHCLQHTNKKERKKERLGMTKRERVGDQKWKAAKKRKKANVGWG